MTTAPLLLLLAAYVAGSIPFSYLIPRLVTGKDIRSIGSGNVGATNVARMIGKGAGLAALLLDAPKGYLAVWLAGVMFQADFWPRADGLLSTPSFWLASAGVMAVAGHMFPVWLNFRGGKGVATAAGVFLALSPLSLAIAFVIFLIVELTTRYVSLASILAAAAMPLAVRFIDRSTIWIVLGCIVIALAVIMKHHANIARLAQGTEPKFPS